MPDLVPMEDDETERETTPLGRASEMAHALIAEMVEAAGGRVVTIVTMIHAEDVTPNAAVDIYTADDGPQTGEDLLSFALGGCNQIAKKHGLTFRVLRGGGHG